MQYNSQDRTFDTKPTLTDTQVLEFCKQGYIILDGVVPKEINEKVSKYLAKKIPPKPSKIPSHLTLEMLKSTLDSPVEPNIILLEDWFINEVLLNSDLGGVLRSLLGKNVGLPVLVSKHSTECPQPAQPWHHDGDVVFGPEVSFLETFYYPQDTPIEMGPTDVVPGSHIGLNKFVNQADELSIATVASAGSFVLHSQSIYHRRGRSTGTGIRDMLKFNYWRTTSPTRDWIKQPEFDFATADYGGHFAGRYYAHMFYWLCGKEKDFKLIGGQGWPWNKPNQIAPSYGYNAQEGYKPDWSRLHEQCNCGINFTSHDVNSAYTK